MFAEDNDSDKVLISGPRSSGVWILAMFGFVLGCGVLYTFPSELAFLRSAVLMILIMFFLGIVFGSSRLKRYARPRFIRTRLCRWILFEVVCLLLSFVFLLSIDFRVFVSVAFFIIGLHLIPLGKIFGIFPYVLGGGAIAFFAIVNIFVSSGFLPIYLAENYFLLLISFILMFSAFKALKVQQVIIDRNLE